MKPKESELMVKTGPNFSEFSSTSAKEKHVTKSRKLKKYTFLFQRLFGVSFVLNLALLAVVIYFVIIRNQNSENESIKCTAPGQRKRQVSITDTFGSTTSIFQDLTLAEISYILIYMYKKSSLNLTSSEEVNLTSSFIYSIELFIPSKADVIHALSNDKEKVNSREARVVIFDGSRKVVDEYIVGPVGKNWASMKIRKNERGPRVPVPYRLRQVGLAEMWEIMLFLQKQEYFHDILKESFGATLFKCIDEIGQEKCLVAYKSYIPLVHSARRMLWIMFYYDLEYYTLYPLDFQLLVDVDALDQSQWVIKKVWYANKMYDTYSDFITKYRSDSISKVKLSFPKSAFGSLHTRKQNMNSNEKRPPMVVEMDGPRYDISGQSVSFQNWKFSWVNSLNKGPTLFDIRFNDERIVYELGLQDIVVLYTGDNPTMSRAAFADGFTSLGSKSAGLVPGIDCPSRATFLNVTIRTEDFHVGGVLPNAICIFEHNSERPLRRHYSTVQGQGGVFYGGLVGTSLIFRTIFVVNNYDYILDYVFSENGAIEAKMYPTGYLMTSFPLSEQAAYGFKVGHNVTGNMHLHLFHFKVDIDVLGTKNRYKTIDIESEEFVPFEPLDNNDTSKQYRYKFLNNIKATEEDTAYHFNFSNPKYHIIYNDKETNKFGEYRGYRISARGFVNQLLPENVGFETTIPWSRYQMAVLRHKDQEESSSSPYATLDAGSPVVNFRDFIKDNETIIDEDLVAWLTLGVHHIPRSEDIPNTVTSGMEMSILLSPFNYFYEDPSINSPDAVRITPNHDNSRLNIDYLHRTSDNKVCSVETNNYEKLSAPSLFFPYH